MTSLHLSGEWNRPDPDVRRATLALIEAHKPLAVSHTEAGRHLDALADIPGFMLHGSNECALHLRDDIDATARTVPLSPLPIPRRGGAQCEALVVKVAASVLGPSHTRIIVHLPSGVEGVAGFRRTEQARVWRDCIAGLRELVASIDGPVVITGDWNVSLRRRWVRRYLRAQFPGFALPRLPRRGGTHGRRWIDFSISRGLVPAKTARAVRNAASDHRAVIEEHTAMTMLTNLATVLRDAGIKVVEVDGWKTRSRPARTGGFDPVGVLCHHTATSKARSDRDVVIMLVRGRPDLPGPLCHLGLARDGTVYVIAAGRANHAGKAKASGTVAAGDGNELYVGIEAFNDGVGEPWPKVQMDAYVKLCAVLSLKVTGNSASSVRGHKETSVTGKIDPTFDMPAFRDRVAAAMKPTNTLAPTRMTRVRAELEALARARQSAHPIQARAIRAALAMLPKR